MFLVLVLGAVIVAVLVWAGRRPTRAGHAIRLGSGLASALAAVGAIVSMLRGGWPLSVVLIGLSAYLAHRARLAAPDPAGGAMSTAQARSILGVGPDAGRPEIDAAYRRLMQRAHPDAGGSAGLAAQLNAARDRLRKP
jgi:hypothetical protein